jgi:hypothetical protein
VTANLSRVSHVVRSGRCSTVAGISRYREVPPTLQPGTSMAPWSVPAFLDTGLGCQLTELPIS